MHEGNGNNSMILFLWLPYPGPESDDLGKEPVGVLACSGGVVGKRGRELDQRGHTCMKPLLRIVWRTRWGTIRCTSAGEEGETTFPPPAALRVLKLRN